MYSKKDFLGYTDGIPFFNMFVRGVDVVRGKTNYWSMYDKANKWYSDTKKMYDRTDLDAFEWRDKHSDDFLIGKVWKMANARDLYAEKEKYQEDLKKNTGYNWKDNAYPRSAYYGAFGNTARSQSPLFEVNDAIMALYNGVRKW